MSYFDIRKLLLIVGIGALGPWGTAWSRGAASGVSQAKCRVGDKI